MTIHDIVLHSLSNLIAEEEGACRRKFVYIDKHPVNPCKEDHKFQHYVWASSRGNKYFIDECKSINFTFKQGVEGTNISSVNVNPSNHIGETRQNKAPSNQSGKGERNKLSDQSSEGNSSDQNDEREENQVEERDKKRNGKKRRRSSGSL